MKLRSGGHFNDSAAHDRSHSYGSDQAKPVARAAFFATRLTRAPVFRTALFADFMAFAVLDFLRFAIFVPLDFRFAQLGCFLHLCQALFGLIEMTRRLNCLSNALSQKEGSGWIQPEPPTWGEADFGRCHR
jgi:hypothetical protein